MYYVTSIKPLALGLLLHVLSLQLQVEMGAFLGLMREDVPLPCNIPESGPSERIQDISTVVYVYLP